MGQTKNTETEVRTETEQTEVERLQSTEDKTQEDQAQKENGQSGDVQTVHSEEVQAAAEERATPAEALEDGAGRNSGILQHRCFRR